MTSFRIVLYHVQSIVVQNVQFNALFSLMYAPKRLIGGKILHLLTFINIALFCLSTIHSGPYYNIEKIYSASVLKFLPFALESTCNGYRFAAE